MADSCLPERDKLKLVRDGSAQGDRFPAVLDPASVPVHDRGLPQAMLFAREYAAFLNYYDLANEKHGDWYVFFSRDVSVKLAATAVQDVDRFRSVLRTCLDALEDPENAGSVEVVSRTLSLVFAMLGTLAAQIDALQDRLPDDTTLKATIASLIRSRLASPLVRLVSWSNADLAGPRLIRPTVVLPDPSDDYEVSILGVGPIAFRKALAGGLKSDAWKSIHNVPADLSVFGSGTPFARARSLARHALFGGACDAFLKVYARIRSDAGKELEATYQDDRHDPHYALFLAFLRMFEYARKDINALAGKHLDFYYGKVLQLTTKPAEPAQAHVIVELSKNASSYELDQGSELKAGKDGEGNLVVFTSDAPLVANKACLSSIMRLYRDATADAIDVDSATTVGEEPWHPFQNDVEAGWFGFAVASHYLYLAEGKRTITLTVTVQDDLSLDGDFACRLTTENGWLEISPTTVVAVGKTLTIEVILEGDQAAITAYDEDVHASAYDVALPVLEVKLNTLTAFQALESASVQSLDLKVLVEGFRSLVLSNDLGPIDASKPFQPFGPSPVPGNALIVGCPEAFSKQERLATFELSFSWRNLERTFVTTLSAASRSSLMQEIGQMSVLRQRREAPTTREADTSHIQEVAQQKQVVLSSGISSSSVGSIQVSVWALQRGEWKETISTVPLPTSGALGLLTSVQGDAPQDDPDVAFVTPFSLDATRGYLKLRLETSFGNETYAQDVAAYAIAVVRDEAASMPTEPYTPEWETIALKYEATQTIALATVDEEAYEDRAARFYHVTAFGVAEQHAYLRQESEDSDVSLLPLLRHRNALDPALPAATPVSHEGELYLGLAGVQAPQNVALLFQVVDGSADPLTEKPDPHLHFSYLRDGDWVAFTEDQVADGTSELLASGIVTFSIPADATTEDSLLPGGLTWIRIAAGERTEAVCRLLDVKAQALRATFADRNNDLAFLATPLAAGTIAKLVTPVASVKSVSQPYPSFGARREETPRSFRTRVSERLRHKDRAIALWDVERLVLEAFPAIYRVTCLNHLRYEPLGSKTGIYQELAAGHLTVLTIPLVSEGYEADPLTPYTSLGMLEEIDTHLRARLSCFATLHVCNPAYERLRVECNVKLREGCDETSSLKGLKTALTEFLAPWAYDATLHPTFQGKVYRSALINFLEEQACVDFVTDFHLFRRTVDGVESEAGAVVEGSLAVSVLTSVLETEHMLTALQVTDASGPLEVCGCAP